MAWIYFQESEESVLLCPNGSGPSHIAKLIPTVKEFSYLSFEINNLSLPLSGTIFDHSVPHYCPKDVSTSFMAAFLARILVLRQMAKAWMESEVDCSLNYLGWFKSLDPTFYFLKMSPLSARAEEIESLKKLSKWGWTAVGFAFQPKVLEQNIKERDGSFWPTPDASCRGARKSQFSRLWRHHYTLQDAVGSGKLNPQWIEWLMGYNSGHTELEPWVIPWFLSKQKKPLKS